MQKSEIVTLAIVAFLGYLFMRYAQTGTIPTMGSLNNPVESGGATSNTMQDVYGAYVGIPVADYTSGPVFYVQNQPWYFQSNKGNIMPMTAGSTNITGAPSAQVSSCC